MWYIVDEHFNTFFKLLWNNVVIVVTCESGTKKWDVSAYNTNPSHSQGVFWRLIVHNYWYLFWNIVWLKIYPSSLQQEKEENHLLQTDCGNFCRQIMEIWNWPKEKPNWVFDNVWNCCSTYMIHVRDNMWDSYNAVITVMWEVVDIEWACVLYATGVDSWSFAAGCLWPMWKRELDEAVFQQEVC